VNATALLLGLFLAANQVRHGTMSEFGGVKNLMHRSAKWPFTTQITGKKL
jgi:hypothetical protein